MHAKKSEVATSLLSEEFPAPSHAHHIVDSNRDDSRRRVYVNGADMSNIFRAYRGRLNLSYWKTEDNQKVCEDAMELLDEILIERGCEPSVIITYVALVREIYSHACVNIKQMNFSDERRKIEMLEQWRQIERHFLKVKHAMSDCWPIGNETDLLTVYLSLALLYSLYKDVCDEGVITVCFEAAQRARRCGAYKLSKNEFAEIQQYCDTIENIYFLRKQRILNGQSYFVDEPFVDRRNRQNLGGPPPERAPYRRLPDGKAILAEYGKMTYNATTKMRKAMARTRALEALKLIQGAHAIRNDGKCRLVCEQHSKEVKFKAISPSNNVSECIKQLLNSIVGQVAGECVVEESCDNLSNTITNMPSSESAFNGKQGPRLVQTDKLTHNEESNNSLSSSAASNRLRRGVNRNESIFVETTTVTVETLETRTQTTNKSQPKSTIRCEKPMRLMGVVRDQKVLVENYAELRLSDEEPPSLKEGRFNLHTASVEGRSAEQVSQKQASLPPSELSSPPPRCFPSSPTSAISASPIEAAAYRAMPLDVSLSSSIPAKSTTSEILSPKSTDSLLSGVSLTEPPQFLTNSSVIASLLHSTANVPTTLSSPTPSLMHSPIEKNTTSLAPEMHSPSLTLPQSSLSLSSHSDPREALPLPTTTSVLSSTEFSILPTTTSPSLVATTTPSPTTSDGVPAAFPSPPPSPSNPPESASPSSVAAPSVQIIRDATAVSGSSAHTATSDSSKVISSPIVSPSSSSPPPLHPPPPSISASSTAQPVFLSSPTTAPSPPFTASSTSFSTNVPSAILPVAPFPPKTMPLSTASPFPMSTTSTSIPTVSFTPHMTTPSYSSTVSPLISTLTLTPPVLSPAAPSPPPLIADSSPSSAPIKTPNPQSPPQLPISATSLSSKDVAPSLRPSAPPPPPPPLTACSDSSQALATSSFASDSPPLTETMPPTHPSPSQSSGSPTTRPSVPPPPPPFSASSAFAVQSTSEVSSVLPSPRPPLHSLQQNPSATSPPRSIFPATSILSELTPASVTILEATTPPYESHPDSITPFRSSVSPRRPLYTPTSSTPRIVSLHGRTSVDTDALLRSFHNTSETLEQCTMRTLSADSACLHAPTSAIKTEDSSKNIENGEEFIKQTTITNDGGIMNSEEMREYFESKGNLKAVMDHIADSEVHQQIPSSGSLAMVVETKEAAIEKEIGDLEESVHKAVSTTYPYEMPTSLEVANLAMLSQILSDHEMSVSDNASAEENRRHFRKAAHETVERLNKKDVCDTSLVSELATSWIAHQSGNVNVWREDEKQQDIKNISLEMHTNDNTNLISFEEPMAKQLQVGVTSISASDTSIIDATNVTPKDDSNAQHSEVENDNAAMKLENEVVELDKQNKNCNGDDDADSDVTSFSKFRSVAAISKQYKASDQLSFDIQNRQDDTSFSLLNELKRSFTVERNTDNAQLIPPVLKHVKQASEVIECTQKIVDEDVEEEIQRVHLEEKSINEEESMLEEQSSDVEEITNRQPQGFIPMHEEIISAISTLRHVSDLPKPNIDDTADGASIAQRSSQISQPKHVESMFESPATASVGYSSTMDAEDRDDSASTQMTFFDPRLEFERRIKLKKNLKPKLNAPMTVKNTKTAEISLKRFSGSRSSRDMSSESEKKTTSAGVSLDKDTNKPHAHSDSADSDGYYDTVNC